MVQEEGRAGRAGVGVESETGCEMKFLVVLT